MTPSVDRRSFLATSMAADLATPALAASGSYRAFELGTQTTGADGEPTLHMVTRPALAPGHGEVLMRVRATGIGARDLRIILGDFGPLRPPNRVPGQDNAGDVIAVGPGVETIKVGDRVVCCHYPLYLDGAWDIDMARLDYGNILDGFYAEQAVLPAAALVKIPDHMSYEEASTLQSSVLTPWRGLMDAKTLPGETVLTLGTGNVSVFGLQLAKMLGSRVIVTSSSDEKLAKVRSLGADLTVNYARFPDWEKEVLRLTEGRGADVVLNTVGYVTLEKSLASCASNGRVMQLGAAESFRTTNVKGFPNLIMRDLTIKGFTVGSRAMLADLIRAIDANDLKPHIDRVFPFEQTLDAIRYARGGERVGKVVIRMA
jgi:NADPH:quinone reductase-like Zn-dependent oxidoreductase